MSAILFQESVLQAGDPLQPLLSQLPTPGSHLAIPALFDTLVQKYHHNRYSIFTQASSSKVAHDVFVAGKEREAVRLALERTLDRLGGGDITAWQTRSALWKTIEMWGGYMEREPSWSRLLDSETRATQQALNSGDPSIVGTLLGTLVSLERLDHDQANLGPDVVRWCLAVSELGGELLANVSVPCCSSCDREILDLVSVAILSPHPFTSDFL
ncbi:uncharacterized protein L199_001575 [Kwoniella botswanensis]|uniref:uncharacterized protein n=1 Tax=Kwoniella botswanensis TaxID=1268659 RepID=UPI00315C85D9